MSVTHQQVYKQGAFGTVNTTLCGRVASAEWEKNDGMNVEGETTCKLCLKIKADPKHWRNRGVL